MSAVAILNKESAQIIIKARLVLYGKYAENELGQKIVDEINQMWNQPEARVAFGSHIFDIIFIVDYACLTQNQVLQLALENTDFAINFIRIPFKIHPV